VTLAVDPAHADGEWIRHAPHRSDLLGRAATPTDGRWQHGAVVPGLYLAQDTATAAAEWYRFLAELGIPPSRAVPHDHHVWRLNLELADLSSARQLASVGLPPPRPGRATWPPYQDVGEALWREGWAGLLAPSAARPDGRIACIFASHWPPEHCTPIRANEITETPPPPQGMTT
jgi:RES domain-containing protein